MMRGVIAHILNQFHDEEIQVNGMMFLLDTTAFGMKHQVYFPPEGYKKGFNIFQVCEDGHSCRCGGGSERLVWCEVGGVGGWWGGRLVG